jgi:hypothetical protein
MSEKRELPPDFLTILSYKDKALIDRYLCLRSFVLSMFPQSNELLYHTHALTSLFTVSLKMSDGFCMLPMYTNHLNLGFNKGTLLNDPAGLLQGTGKLIRHIPVKGKEDYHNDRVMQLLKEAYQLAVEDSEVQPHKVGLTVSKLKQK